MSYVESHLNPGERVVHQTTIHPIIFLSSGLPALLSLFFFTRADLIGIGVLLVLLALTGFAWAWMRYKSSKFAVTTSRVIIKVGILSRPWSFSYPNWRQSPSTRVSWRGYGTMEHWLLALLPAK